MALGSISTDAGPELSAFPANFDKLDPAIGAWRVQRTTIRGP